MSFTPQVLPEYADNDDAPLAAVTVTNPSGYRNLRITVDTKGGRKHSRTRRLKITSGTGSTKETSVYIADEAVDNLIEALGRMQDFGIDGAAA